ncbi:periplasmic heavy metal sensor [Brachyspira sp.]|uniref:Spy/CpxP family protein refolding chaperone n=1 Tax=Brachyspira sp. TaxID=1977261 RepID=UPI002626BF03|nr:periplasmic heavy metal sensor [Brachyspira sp.]
MNNKISKKSVILISIAIMVLASVSLFAQYGYGRGRYDAGYDRGHGYGRGGCGYGYGRGHGYGRGGCGYGHGRGGYGYYNSTLTQEQIDKIKTIEDKYYPQMDALRREIYNQTDNINVEMRKESPDKNVIDNAIDLRSKASADLQKLRTEYLLEIDKVYQNR